MVRFPYENHMLRSHTSQHPGNFVTYVQLWVAYGNISVMATIDRNPSEGLNAAVATELRRERAARQVTIDTIVELTGLSRSTVLNTLNAKRLLGVEAVAAIAQALGVSVTTIFSRAEVRLASDRRKAAFA